jgi:hypothetical protein
MKDKLKSIACFNRTGKKIIVRAPFDADLK